MNARGYVAICPHFHQPHFQLHKTREKVFNSSYLSWLDLLYSLSATKGFYINIHFSGPFLYWINSEKKEYLIRLQELVRKGNIGVIGGYADEAFIQLSTRTDDVLFQIMEYEELTKKLFNIHASDWQGFHIPERECGELLIRNTSKVLSMIGASAIYYLDAETFYTCHNAEPGGTADYCNRIFGFEDPVSRTTISHYPKSMLRFAFRDMIGGNTFISIPIHCEERYWFLKSDATFGIHPMNYLNKIKQILQCADEQLKAIGRDTRPIVVIFEDAEKFGDWSGHPDLDAAWLRELVELICKDKDVALIGLKDYCIEQGCFDTYPIRSSHSYIEWENWTAKRGIRGVAYSDEKIRKMVALLHRLEYKIECFEQSLLKKFTSINNNRLIAATMDAPDRYVFFSEILSEKVNITASEQYLLIQRIRNLLYQEDSKWATRHPNYGSAPYLDNIGVCYLVVAERLLLQLESLVVNENSADTFQKIDWMEDYRERFVIQTEHQTLSIDPNGASIDYHVVLNHEHCIDVLLSKILPDIRDMNTYPSIYRYVVPVVFTETDSLLCHEFDAFGGRVEKCRRSFAICLSRWNGTDFELIADFRNLSFLLQEQRKTEDGYRAVFQAVTPVKTEDLDITVELTKTYFIRKDGIIVKTSLDAKNITPSMLFLSTEVVTSLTASDEVYFRPSEGLTIPEGENQCHFDIRSSEGHKKSLDCPSDGTVFFTYGIHTGAADMFCNGIKFSFFAKSSIARILVTPTVSNYYKNYVGPKQSHLGYTSSGTMMMPYTQIIDGKADLIIEQSFLWNVKKPLEGLYLPLV